jgi:hypothetical protein
VLAPTSEDVLTLITCYPFWVIGPAPDRFIVRAARVADHAPATIEAWSLPSLDLINAPALDRVRATEPVSTPIVTPRDDESLVRETVTRYLRSQGVRLASCGVSISGDRARADCESAAPSTAPEQPGRMFSLERSHLAWAIRSIELSQRE